LTLKVTSSQAIAEGPRCRMD